MIGRRCGFANTVPDHVRDVINKLWEYDDMNNEQKIEQEIQEKNLNAPRLTPGHIDAVIVGETFTVLPSGKVMVCELTLRNGFTVRGEAATVSKENFDEELGRKISRENARSKVWEVEGYLLQEGVYANSLVQD